MMEKTTGSEARERIINAAIELFSRKGYDATTVNDIAGAANVNKALIYYYFKNKQDILDFMVDSILDDAVSGMLDYIQTNIVQMVRDGHLDIKPDRLHFANDEAINAFLQNSYKFYERVIDYVIAKKEIIRIMVLESLKKGKHQNSLFRFMKFMSGNDENPFFKTISSADQDFVYSEEMVLFKFFFSIIPIVSFAAYFDDYKAVSSLSDAELRRSFMRVYHIINKSLISGSDILLRSHGPDA
ncbi:MAG TPA: TetR family transcriptional regulator [Clostridiales bacterium]|nr:TetR family transcriptional regulator [Clostridiales bacterium]